MLYNLSILYFFLKYNVFVLANNIPASEFSYFRSLKYFQPWLFLPLQSEPNPFHWLAIVIEVKFQLIYTPGCATE